MILEHQSGIMIQVISQVECITVKAQNITSLQASTFTWHLLGMYAVDFNLVYTRYILGLYLAYEFCYMPGICHTYAIPHFGISL
jgi:hypothetical protein